MEETRPLILVFGGSSSERFVSVASAQNVSRVLPEAVLWFLDERGRVFVVSREIIERHARPFEQPFQPASSAHAADLATALSTQDPHTIFVLALHGGQGEDGTVQRLLEDRRFPFTGSGSIASALAMDKEMTKRLVKERGIHVATSLIVSPANDSQDMLRRLHDFFLAHDRLIAKPVVDGSSLGIIHIKDLDEMEGAARRIQTSHQTYLIEPFIHGTELTVGVMEEDGEVIALPPTEIRLENNATFDFAGKYLSSATREITPAEIPKNVTSEAQRVAVLAHRTLGCRGYSRTDMIADPHGRIVFLEINTLPGLTERSFIPQQLYASGRDLRLFMLNQLAIAQEKVQKPIMLDRLSRPSP